MSDDEKRFKLDELPDAGSEPIQKKAPKKITFKAEDPRVKNLRSLDDKGRVEAMTQSWTFDHPDWSIMWIPWAFAIAAAEFSGFFSNVQSDLNAVKGNPWLIGSDSFMFFLEFGAVFLKHPIILLVLFPIFFRFRKPSEYLFEIKFDGVHTVRKYVPRGSKELVSKVFVKWDNIHEVKKKKVDDKEVLSLYAPDGHIADIIWYIEHDKKRALKLLLSGMISPKHPLRVFLEKEKELM